MEIIYIFAIFFLGAILTFGAYLFLKNLLNEESLVKENYSRRKIPTLGGIVPLTALLVGALLIRLYPDVSEKYTPTSALIIIALGFALIGLLDDLVGDKSSQGFKGHIKSLFKGNLTTGALKMFGGPIIALAALSPLISQNGYIRVFVDAAAISLCANFFNLLDLSPGRSSKVLSLVVAVAIFIEPENKFAWLVLAIVLVSLSLDLQEKYMLGDIGSNFLGAITALSLVIALDSFMGSVIILIVSLALNLISEKVSYSKVILKIKPLLFLDELGQSKERKAFNRKK